MVRAKSYGNCVMSTVRMLAIIALGIIWVGYAVLILGYQKPGYIRYSARGDASSMARTR